MVENTKEELPEYVLDPNDIPDIGDPIQIEENDARARLTIDFTIGELQLRVDNIARQISETITTLLDELIKQTTQSLGEVTSEDELYRIESTLAILKDPVKGRREILNENRVGISNIYRAVKAA